MFFPDYKCSKTQRTPADVYFMSLRISLIKQLVVRLQKNTSHTISVSRCRLIQGADVIADSKGRWHQTMKPTKHNLCNPKLYKLSQQ